MVCRVQCSPSWSATRSKVYWIAARMPRPRKSNLTRPIAAQLSLSHCSTVRASIRPRSIGHTSPTGRSVSTMPPEWMPRCRGALSSWLARSTTGSGISWSASAIVRVGVDLLAPGVLLAGGVAQRLGHVPDRRLGPVADHVGHLGGVAPAVAAVDLLDHLLAAVGVEVDVDVGLLLPGGGQEPLEGQLELDRVHRGDAEHVADHRVGRRAPALAEDALVRGRSRPCRARSGSSPGSPSPR